MFVRIFLDAAPAGNGGGSPWMSLVMLLIIVVIFYFFLIRPQQKKQKAANKFREGLQKGDKVVTIGGIYGKICEVHDTFLLLEVDTNVKIKVDKTAVVADSSQIQQGN